MGWTQGFAFRLPASVVCQQQHLHHSARVVKMVKDGLPSIPEEGGLKVGSGLEVALKSTNGNVMRRKRSRETVLAELVASSLSSAAGFFLADFLCQCYTRKFSILRFLHFGLAGGLTYGAVAFMGRCLISDSIQDRSFLPTLQRVMLDQVVGTPLFVGSLLVVLGRFSTPRWIAAVRMGWGLWASAHLVNFTVLPKKWRLTFFNVVQVSYNIALRFMVLF